MVLPLEIVHDLDFVGIPITPFEADAPLGPKRAPHRYFGRFCHGRGRGFESVVPAILSRRYMARFSAHPLHNPITE
jgi:hypothetical protein